jgi:hypothetical protein
MKIHKNKTRSQFQLEKVIKFRKKIKNKNKKIQIIK